LRELALIQNLFYIHSYTDNETNNILRLYTYLHLRSHAGQRHNNQKYHQVHREATDDVCS